MSSYEAPPLLAGLVDDAGLFPPEELSMPAALARHREDEALDSSLLTGLFLCPVNRLVELLAELARGDHLHLALVTPLEAKVLGPGLERFGSESRITLAGVEGRLGDEGLAALATVPNGVPCSVEVPTTGNWQAALSELAEARHRAKVRCGGASADLFPSAEQLGRFVLTCAELGLPFKATAGLHHALPYRDPQTGFQHHGFLNLLLAACRAAEAAAEKEVIRVLEDTGSSALVREARAVTPEHAAAARGLLISYGSCSTSQPVDDLVALGLLGRPAAGR